MADLYGRSTNDFILGTPDFNLTANVNDNLYGGQGNDIVTGSTLTNFVLGGFFRGMSRSMLK